MLKKPSYQGDLLTVRDETELHCSGYREDDSDR